MFSSQVAINNHPYHDTSSSSSSFSTSSSCSSLDITQEEYILLKNKSNRQQRAFKSNNNKKDVIYCSQRSRNNLSSKRSRIKRCMNDLVLETKLTQLTNENEILRAKIDMLTKKFGHLNNQEDEQSKSIEKPTVLNILDQLSVTTTEHSSSIPIKWRCKLLNKTSIS